MRAISDRMGVGWRHTMDGATIKAEAAGILADLPDRIRHVICQPAKERPDHLEIVIIDTLAAGTTGKIHRHRLSDAARTAAT